MQLDLFGAPAPARAPSCPHHGPEYVCEFEGLDTDHSGFVHRSLCSGRIALRQCARCKHWKTPGTWNHADWYHCLDCVPLGQLSDMGRPVAEALTEARARPKKRSRAP
jgi:hypothetical protein